MPTFLAANLLAQSPEMPTLGGVVYPPLLFAIVGGALYAALYLKFRENSQGGVGRRIAIAILSLAFLLSARTLLQLTGSLGEIYRDAIGSKVTLLAHYAMPVLTLVALAAAVYFELGLRRAEA
jgi:hypothetical protein